MQKIFEFKYYKNLVVVLFIALLILFFYSRSIVDKDKYYITINILNEIKETNAELYSSFYLIKTNKIRHYDLLRENIKTIFQKSDEALFYTKNIDFKPFNYNWEKYINKINDKELALENLLSHFSIYKNFISHYPKLSNDLFLYFQNQNKELATKILDLQNNILIYNYTNKNIDLSLITLLEQNLNSLNEKDKRKLEHLILYTNKLIEYKNSVEELEKEFISLDLNESLNLLITNYNVYYNLLEKDSRKYQFLMMSLSLFLLILILFVIVNLNKANSKVKETINELNFQKLALDEHAIVSITDKKGNITYVNDKFCQISGYKEDELIGKNHRVLKSDEHSDEFFENLWKTIVRGKTWQGEVKNFKKDGGYYWVNATIVPFLDEDKKPFKYISIRTDITNRKKVEEDLIESKKEAESANRIKSDFLANMSHELRTPLNGVLGMAHIAYENEKDEKQKAYLEKINSSANILLKIINDLLDYSKIEAGKLSIENSSFNIDTLLQNVADLLSVKAYEKDLELIFNRDMQIPKTIIGDSLRLSQVLVNILGNSIKFTEKGEVSLEIKIENKDENSSFLLFIICDTGIGMGEETLNTIFNSFTQADASTSRKYGGTGLGLTITKNLIELMDGKIFVESKLGIGSKFIVKIPFKMDKTETKIDYKLTNDITINLYSLSNSILKIMKEILSSLHIKYKEIEDILSINSDFEKNIVITEDEEVTHLNKSFPTIVLLNANKSIKTQKDNIKIITKPINPSIIYDSILEFVNISKKSFQNSVSIKGKKGFNAKVLLVEDNELNQLVATTFLESFSCSVTLANNGLEAVEFLKNKDFSFDIIFMDVQMPIMNGYEATKIIREELKLDIPIIAMTANAMKEDIEKSIEVGMNRHISKPIDPNEIEKALLTYIIDN